MKNLNIFECKDYEEWDKFILESPQYNFFSMSEFFKKHEQNHKLFFLRKNNEPIIAFPVFIDKDKVKTIPFSYYQGIHYSKKIDNLHYFRKYSWLRYSYEHILEFLVKRFNGFFLDMHPSIKDIRYINWYFQKNKVNGFEINNKYTAVINFKKFNSFQEVQSCYRKDRLQDIKYTEKMKLKISEDCNPEIFISLLRKTYEKNNENISDDIIKTIEYFFTFLKKKMKIISLLKSNNVIASQLIFFDLKSAHAVAQVTDSKYLKQGVSSYLTDRIIEYSFNKKMRYLDFNGCNSPHRADFKHSFGAEPKLYFRINSGLNYV